MTVARVKKNFGFLLAGAVLFGVGVNVWYEVTGNQEGRNPCLCISTP